MSVRPSRRAQASDGYPKPVAILVSIMAIVALALSIGWRVPYIYTFAGAAMLVLMGHIITIDDDLPGGFSNPDGSDPFPWPDLLVKLAIALLLGFAALVPAVAAFGR